MFNKLRIRLVLTNVVISGLIVVVMAAIAYLMITQSITKQSQQVLQLISADVAQQTGNGDVNPDVETKMMNGLYPYFIVLVDNNGQSIKTNFKTGVTDDRLLSIIKTILTAETEKKQQLNNIKNDIEKKKAAINGVIGTVVDMGNRSFRYSDVSGRGGTSWLIFLDMEQEKSLEGKVLFSLILCVFVGLVMVFLGGLFLAERAIRPIRLSWQRQRDFVADASHELRSPLAGIRSSVDVVLSKPESTVADQSQFLEGISAEATRMAVLVDDMLLIARADSDAVIFAAENVNIARVAESAVSLMKHVAEKKQLSCELNINATPLIRGDAERIKQVLLILLDNAVKYTPEGGSINATVKYHSGEAIVEVSDTGIGIGEEHLPHIFERFYRADKARSGESGGQGLGLSIAIWIVERHHGSITANSKPGYGSTFTVILPEA